MLIVSQCFGVSAISLLKLDVCQLLGVNALPAISHFKSPIIVCEWLCWLTVEIFIIEVRLSVRSLPSRKLLFKLDSLNKQNFYYSKKFVYLLMRWSIIVEDTTKNNSKPSTWTQHSFYARQYGSNGFNFNFFFILDVGSGLPIYQIFTSTLTTAVMEKKENLIPICKRSIYFWNNPFDFKPRIKVTRL